MACVDRHPASAGIMFGIRLRLPFRAGALLLGGILPHAAEAAGVAGSSIGDVPEFAAAAATPAQFVIGLVLLAAGIVLISWLGRAPDARRTPANSRAGHPNTSAPPTESERKLRQAQRLANIGSWERNFLTDEGYWSDQVYEIFGLPMRSERISMDRFYETVHPEDREDVRKSVAHALATGEDFRKTYRIVRPSGEVRTVQQLAEVMRGEDGKVVRFVGTVQDITDLRRAQDAMRRSEAWFRAAFVAGGAGMVVADAKGKYLRVNPAFCKLIGYSEAELRGMYTRDVTHPDDRPTHDEIWARLVQGTSEISAREKRYLTKSGETVWAIIAAATFRDQSDGTTYIISNIQDITERKLAEQALADREATLLAAQQLANIGNWARDLKTSVITWSDRLYEIFGREKKSFDGSFESFLAMVHPDDRSIVINRRGSWNKNGHPSSAGFRIVRPDGEIRYVRTTRRVECDADGKPARAVGVMQDVTELTQAREALEESEARFRGVFEAGGAGIVVIDGDGAFQQINRAFADFLGYDEEDLAELTIFDVLRQADHEELLRNRDSLFAGMVDRVSSVYRFAHWDGGARWGTVTAAAMPGPGGDSRLMVLTVQDVTRRVLADEALAHKTRLIDLVNELAVAANNATDFKDVVRLCLTRVCEFAGWCVGHAYQAVDDGQDVESLGVWYLSDPGRFARYREVTEKRVGVSSHGMVRAVLDHRGIEWRHRIPISDTNINPRARLAVEVGLRSGFAVPVRAGDEVVAVLEFASDKPIVRDDGLADAVLQIGTELGRVFERQRAETALRRREEQLSQIIDNAPLWIFVIDRDGRYLLANKSVALAHGLTPEKMVGRTLQEIHDDPGDVASLRAGDDDVVGKQIAHGTYTAEFHASGGDVRVLRIVKVPFTTHDGDTAVLGMAADITDERRAETELRRAQRLDALGHMTGGVAHDFNNLLTIILGNLQLLLRQLEDPAASTLAETAERAARRGADVTRRLLAFARSQPLEPRPVDVNALLADMVALVERTLGNGIEIERRLADSLWTTMADPAQLENALINLVVNARDAMPDGGKVTLSTANVTFGKNSKVRRQADVAPGDYVRVAVCDTGVGMTEDVAARALEPFFTTKDVGKGSGLGLSSIYGFARQSGGGVRIQTMVGRGTKVSIFLPRCTAQPADPAGPQTAETAAGRRETVLLVEDEPDVLAFSAQALEDANYRVIAVGNAEDAMKVLSESGNDIDVLLTDIALPGELDGWALARTVRRRRSDIRIILTSGNWELAGRPVSKTVSDATTLPKPYTHQELAAVVRSAIASGPARKVMP